ncbi:MAG: hypothetical protein H6Q90_4577 [Deltaproteobacteria bacterium]|nr:hypothetical protein [Deltaproteobacteria bacterium]
MKKYLALALSLSFVAACGKGAGVDKITKLKDEACACKDKACGDKVNKQLDDAMEQMAKDMGDKQPDEATTKALMAAMLDAGQCISKLK